MKKITLFSLIIFCLFFVINSNASAEIRTATFDSIVTGTDLTNYSEGNLSITTPKSAFVSYYGAGSYFPSAYPDYPGFSGGFFYPSGGVNAPITIQTTDGAEIFDIKFNAGSGWASEPNVNLWWNIWDDGSIISVGSSTIVKGDQLDIYYQSGFDYIEIYGTQYADFSTLNGLALDNLIVDTSPGVSVPEPAIMLLLGFGFMALAGAKRKMRC